MGSDHASAVGTTVHHEFHPDGTGIWWCRESLSELIAKHGETAVVEGWRKYDGIVFPTVWAATAVRTFCGIPIERCSIIRDFVTPIPKATKNEEPTIVFAGKASNVIGLLTSAVETVAELMGFRADLIVFDNDPASLSETQLEMLTDTKLKYVPNASNAEVREAMSRAHVVAVPATRPAVSSVALLEGISAMASVIAPSYCGFHEPCEPYNTPYYWCEDPGKHVASLAAAIIPSLERVDRTDLARRAAKMTVDSYTQEIFIARWENFGRWLEFHRG